MSGLGYNKFKKIQCDENSTVLRHEDGHTLKIAHSKLSPKMQKELEKLPIYKEGGGYSSDPSDEDSSDNKSPIPGVNIYVGGQNSSQMPPAPPPTMPSAPPMMKAAPPAQPPHVQGMSGPGQPPQAPPEGMPPGQSVPVQSDSDWQGGAGNVSSDAKSLAPAPQEAAPDEGQDDTEEDSPQEQPQVAQKATAPAQGQPQQLTGSLEEVQKMIGDHLGQEDTHYFQDLINGHIQPKTYHDLYAKNEDGTPRGTLSKVGTLFGLMAAGFGSGLTHQPNAVLEMMNNEIERDLKAQIQSKSNAMNFWRLAQEQARTIAGVHLTKAQADTMYWNLAKSKELQTTFADQANLIKRMPEGPQKEKFRQAFGYMYSLVGPNITNLNNAAAGAAAMSHLFTGSSPGTDEGLNNRVNQLNMMGPMGQNRAQKLQQSTLSGVPEVAGQEAPRPVPQGDRDQIQAMQVLDQKGQDLLSYINKNSHLITVNPKIRATAIQKVEEMKNFYNDSIKGGALTEGRLGWYDEQFGGKHGLGRAPTDILPQLMGSTAKLNEMVGSNNMRKVTLLKKLGFTPNQSGGGGSDSGGQIAVNKSTGERLMFKNGKWVPVK